MEHWLQVHVGEDWYEKDCSIVSVKFSQACRVLETTRLKAVGDDSRR